jgi:hypothetical protein
VRTAYARGHIVVLLEYRVLLTMLLLLLLPLVLLLMPKPMGC